MDSGGSQTARCRSAPRRAIGQQKDKITFMNRRTAITSMAATAAAVPLVFAAGEEITDWTGWWERYKKYTLAIAEAMPEDGYNFRPFQGAAEAAKAVRDGDGARSFGELMQHIAQAEGFYLGRLGKGAAPAAPSGD